jgi:hypothetical protein
MPKILNVIIQDWCDISNNRNEWVESFEICENIQQPETALRNAVKEFVDSGTEESKKVLDYACGGFNWGDVSVSVPDELFIKHGLTRIYHDTVNVFVDHDEILCDYPAGTLKHENDNQIIIKKLINEHIINGYEDIKYWERGKNLFAEEAADKISDRIEKLKQLIVMETIDADSINKLIETETDDELILIYEEILENLEPSEEMEDE